MTAFASATTWGATVVDGGAHYRLWAPGEENVALVPAKSGRPLPMQRRGDGWFELLTDAVAVGDGYAFQIRGRNVPDPAARAQMGDVQGPSRLIDPRAYAWHTGTWRGRPWEETVVYELHTGTFSSAGTFAGIEEKLDHLVALGVTAVELMPVAQFGGNRGWGYDGVLLYAPHSAYGGPEQLKALVDAAHARGMMMLLDVVYNHFGPDGNYLDAYAPAFFHPERQTPWGVAIAYDQPAVRSFFIENALYWLNEFRFDGLRLDAIDHIDDQSETPILEALAAEVRRTIPERHIHLTTEDDRNIVRLHERDGSGRPRLYTGEWNDDFHHAAHTVATGEREGYYADYTTGAEDLARALAEGFVYQGQPSAFRDGAKRGVRSTALPPMAFVNFLQNHDQIGNRAFGERLTTLTDPKMLELLTAILLLAPQTPLLFMGEEWAERHPFYYFTDFGGDLAIAVREGRRAEFKKWAQFADPANREKIPDPNSPDTAAASVLDWSGPQGAEGGGRMALVSRLLDIRTREILPHLNGTKGDNARYEMLGTDALVVDWLLGSGASLRLLANLGNEDRAIRDTITDDMRFLFLSAPGVGEAIRERRLPAASLSFALKEAPA